MQDKLLNLKLKYIFFSSLIFLIFYKSAEFYAKAQKNIPSIVMNWENKIPFLPFMIIPYMTSGLMFPIIFFLTKSKKGLILLLKRIIFMTLISTIIFYIYPLKYSFEKAHVENPIYNSLFYLLKIFDSDFNQCPSLHVSFAFLYAIIFYKELKSPFKYLACFWAILTAFSVLFVYQHHFIDFIGGLIVIIITLLIFPEKKGDRL